jgi:hypothetical protein
MSKPEVRLSDFVFVQGELRGALAAVSQMHRQSVMGDSVPASSLLSVYGALIAALLRLDRMEERLGLKDPLIVEVKE